MLPYQVGGAFCNGIRTHGFWNYEERTNHINCLELLAIYLGLNSLANDYYDCEILIRSDNTTAISYVNKMEGTQFPLLNDSAAKIWKWAEGRKIWLFASYVSSKENFEADTGSRCNNIDTE